MAGRKRNFVDRDTFAGRVGLNIRSARERRSLSVDDAADAAGVDRSTWYRLEQGNRPALTGKSIDAVAGTLGVEVGDLLKKPRPVLL